MHIDQHARPAEIAEVFERRRLLGKRAGLHAHRAADLRPVGEGENAAFIAEASSVSATPRRRLLELVSHHQPRHAGRPIDATPAIALGVEDHEQIAREDRALECAPLARVARGLVAFRTKVRKPWSPDWLGAQPAKAGHRTAHQRSPSSSALRRAPAAKASPGGARCALDIRDFVESGRSGQEAPWTRPGRERRIGV